MKFNFKRFLRRLRRIESDSYYIILAENVSPQLYGYVSALTHIQTVDGSMHKYCGEIKVVINNFVMFWQEVLDDAVLEAERFLSVVHRDLLLSKLEECYTVHIQKYELFCTQYLPCETLEEEVGFNDIKNVYKTFMERFRSTIAEVHRFETHGQVVQFAYKYVDISLSRKTNLLEFSHSYLSLALGKEVPRIRASLEEIMMRARYNLRKRQEERDEALSKLLGEMYDKNKERTVIARRERRRTVDLAEVDKCIESIRDNIQLSQESHVINRLDDEVRYWESRFKDYVYIEKTLNDLKQEKRNLLNQSRIYNKYKCLDLPGSKLDTWNRIGMNIETERRKNFKLYLVACKVLLSYFAIRGSNRILYKDMKGTYMIDEFGHQIYSFEHGRKQFHLTCDGSEKVVKELDKYYYDDQGRFKYIDGEKTYQCAPCTSTYKLNEYDLLVKLTKDCGHSEQITDACHLELKDANDIEILPTTDPVDIKGTLTREITDYLWGSFAHILPDSLRDVGEFRASINNPIHMLAHSLIYYKYDRTLKETREARKEVKEYRENIFEKQKQKAIDISLDWKSKLLKPVKPEEFDTSDHGAYHTYIAGLQFINELNEGRF